MMRFYEFYSDEMYYYLVTEYCEGGDLLKKMASQRYFSEKNAANIMRQILAAVEYCHKNKIVHRDLKPENCVFAGEDLDSTLKVIDFGRSKIVEANELFADRAGSVIFNLKFISFILLLLKFYLASTTMKNVIYGAVR